MNSYNPLNGVHATENAWLNNDILKGEWGFDGILMSDWTSVYSTVSAANAGLDLEMPKSGMVLLRKNSRPPLRRAVCRRLLLMIR